MSYKTLNIGGISLTISSPDKEFLDKIFYQYSNFYALDSRDPIFKLNLMHDSWPRVGDDISIRKKASHYLIKGEKFKCRLDSNNKKADVDIINEQTHFNTFLRVLYTQVLVAHKGFLVHAAGLLRKNSAYLFTGPSEAGKTTTANRACGFEVLSDELVIVREINNIFFLYSTPFSGEYSKEVQNLSAPLKNVFFLNKNLKSGFKAKDRLKSLTDLLSNVFFFDQDRDSSQTILQLCNKLTADISSHDINILKCKDLGRFVDEFS